MLLIYIDEASNHGYKFVIFQEPNSFGFETNIFKLKKGGMFEVIPCSDIMYIYVVPVFYFSRALWYVARNSANIPNTCSPMLTC